MEPDPNTPQEMQADPTTPQETKEPESTASEPKAAKRSVLPIFLVILFLLAAGLGFSAYQLNANLTESRQQLADLQGEHAKLQSDYDALKGDNATLSSNLDQTKAELENTNSNLAATQGDLEKTQTEHKTLQEKLALAQKKADILYALSTAETGADILAIDTAIKATNDSQLLAEWNIFAS